MLSPEEKISFWSKVNKTPDYKPGSGCWLWEGKKDSREQAKFYSKKKQYSAVRLAYMLTTGKDPGGKRIYKTCKDPWCVNPQHMTLGQKPVKGGLSYDDIFQIKHQMINAWTSGLGKSLAKKYSISSAMVYAIANGKAYKSVKVENEEKKINRRAKGLSEAQREEIRLLWEKPHPYGYGKTLATVYDVTPTTISHIVRGRKK